MPDLPDLPDLCGLPDLRDAASAGGPGGEAIGSDEVLEALTAILESDAFSAAPRSRDFLAYIVSEQLAGRADRLGEHSVARHALGRPEYDARLNSSVRVQATRVRAALARYYGAEGLAATVRISLPPGSYVPVVSRGHPTRSVLSSEDDAVVAVLPLGAAGPGSSVIGAAVHDAILDRLADFPGLRVLGGPASTTSGLAGARFVLQGTVTVDATTVDLDARLSEASSQRVVWTLAQSLPAGDLDAWRPEKR